MKIVYKRSHTVQPEAYESVNLTAILEIDEANDEDKEYFEGNDLKQIGELLSEDVDNLLDTDVDRTLRLDGNKIQDSHLWVFYGRD